MQDAPIRYENIVTEMRREIILGKHPVGMKIKTNEFCKKYKIGVATSYKILNILVEKGLVKYTPRKGYVVVPFQQEKCMQQIHEEAAEGLANAIRVCKTVELPKDTVATIIQEAYCKQLLPERG